jgi:hypothetical protein
VKFYKLDMKLFTFAVKKGFFRTPNLPPRVEATIPSVCVVAALVGVANHFGYGPFTVFRRAITTNLSCPATAPAPAALTRSRSPAHWRRRITSRSR